MLPHVDVYLVRAITSLTSSIDKTGALENLDFEMKRFEANTRQA